MQGYHCSGIGPLWRHPGDGNRQRWRLCCEHWRPVLQRHGVCLSEGPGVTCVLEHGQWRGVCCHGCPHSCVAPCLNCKLSNERTLWSSKHEFLFTSALLEDLTLPCKILITYKSRSEKIEFANACVLVEASKMHEICAASVVCTEIATRPVREAQSEFEVAQHSLTQLILKLLQSMLAVAACTNIPAAASSPCAHHAIYTKYCSPLKPRECRPNFRCQKPAFSIHAL